MKDILKEVVDEIHDETNLDVRTVESGPESSITLHCTYLCTAGPAGHRARAAPRPGSYTTVTKLMLSHPGQGHDVARRFRDPAMRWRRPTVPSPGAEQP